jgi:flagellar basal body-associated protein FliL
MALIKCPSCGNDISDQAISCPKCGHPLKIVSNPSIQPNQPNFPNQPPQKKKNNGCLVAIIVFIFIFSVGIIASSKSSSTKTSSTNTVEKTTASGEKTTTGATTEATTEAKKEKYEIVGDLSAERDAIGAFYITGTLKNNTNRTTSYVQISFNLYDKDGNLVGSAFANVNNLEPNGTWKFKAMGMDTNKSVTSYKLAKVSGF